MSGSLLLLIRKQWGWPVGRISIQALTSKKVGIITVVTRLELRKLKNMVYETDPIAFVFASTIREASGGVLKRRSSH